MAAERRVIDSISIGIGADIEELKKSLKLAQDAVRGVTFPARDVKLTVKINTTQMTKAGEALVKKIQTLADDASKTYTINPKFKVTDESARQLREDLDAKLKKAGYASVGITANLDPAEINRIKDTLTRKIGKIDIELTYHWKEGPPEAPPGGGGGGTRPTRRWWRRRYSGHGVFATRTVPSCDGAGDWRSTDRRSSGCPEGPDTTRGGTGGPGEGRGQGQHPQDRARRWRR